MDSLNNESYIVRGNEKKKEKNFLIEANKKRENLCCSLLEIEKFLCNCESFCKYIKLYHILK